MLVLRSLFSSLFRGVQNVFTQFAKLNPIREERSHISKYLSILKKTGLIQTNVNAKDASKNASHAPSTPLNEVSALMRLGVPESVKKKEGR